MRKFKNIDKKYFSLFSFVHESMMVYAVANKTSVGMSPERLG